MITEASRLDLEPVRYTREEAQQRVVELAEAGESCVVLWLFVPADPDGCDEQEQAGYPLAWTMNVEHAFGWLEPKEGTREAERWYVQRASGPVHFAFDWSQWIPSQEHTVTSGEFEMSLAVRVLLGEAASRLFRRERADRMELYRTDTTPEELLEAALCEPLLDDGLPAASERTTRFDDAPLEEEPAAAT